MNDTSALGVAGGSSSSTPAAGAAPHSAGASSASPAVIMTPGIHPMQPRPLPQQAHSHAHVAPAGSGYLAGTGYGGSMVPGFPPAPAVGPIPPPPPSALSQIRAQQANTARWMEQEMAMAARQAAISARQQQQQVTLIELEQARVRRALAQYAVTGTAIPPTAAATTAAGLCAAGSASAATLGGAGGALYGMASAASPIAPSGTKRAGGEGIAAAAAVTGAAAGGGSQPSTPQPKKQKVLTGTSGTGVDTGDEVIVVDDGNFKSPTSSSPTCTHRVLQTGLAGPFVRGVLADDERTLATFRSQIGMGPRYFASQILNLAETPFRKDSIVIQMSNIDKLGLSISDAHNLYTKHAVEITSEEMRRKHQSLVADMEERIKQLEDEVAFARSSVGNKLTDKSAEGSTAINNAASQAALGKAEEEYQKSFSANQASHAEEIRKLKKEHEETVLMLKNEIREAKKNHSRTLDGYLQASCEVLKLVRREEKARLL